MSFIKSEHLHFDYTIEDDDEGGEIKTVTAIKDLSLEVEKGQFIAIIGQNGSGKSTFAKHINALLCPTEGTLWVAGMDTREEDRVFDVRRKAGMVFQNPDNQIVASVVEEDVGFGPENLGVPTKEIWERVDKALEAVGMTAYRDRSPEKLSGGQKQRVAIAGVLAMQPECIILDEPTAMLDPKGRKEVLDAVWELHDRVRITVILITHNMSETLGADRVFVMDKGELAMAGTPREIFTRVERLKELRLEVPQMTELAYKLAKEGILCQPDILTIEEMADAICRSL